MIADCEAYVAKFNKFQRHSPNIHYPTEFLRTIAEPYPFMRWAMDIVGLLLSLRQRDYLLVMMDYFMRLVEANAFVQVTKKRSKTFYVSKLYVDMISFMR